MGILSCLYEAWQLPPGSLRARSHQERHITTLMVGPQEPSIYSSWLQPRACESILETPMCPEGQVNTTEGAKACLNF